MDAQMQYLYDVVQIVVMLLCLIGIVAIPMWILRDKDK